MSQDLEFTTQDIIEASNAGNFLQYICKSFRGDQQNRDVIAETLSSLHNKSDLDIVEQFLQLNKSDPTVDFFTAKHLFEQILPLINAPVGEVIECVHHLLLEAGQDLSAGWVAEPFTKFCEKESARVDEALEYILSRPESHNNLLPPVIIAGTNKDMDLYVQKAIELSSHIDIGIRCNALFALGRIQYPSNSDLPIKVLDCLEELCKKEDNDLVLSNAVRTITNGIIVEKNKEDRGIEIIRSALPKCGEHSLYAVSNIFGFETKKLPEQLLDIFLEFLKNVSPEHRGTLKNIGYGLTTLLKQEPPEKGISFLESLLLRQNGEISIDSLDHLAHSIMDQGPAFLGKLMTRWFLKGNYILGKNIGTICDKSHLKDLLLKVDTTQLSPEKTVEHIFIARKAIGFLFLKPITCISIILSLLENSNDVDAHSALGKLLLDPILLNFSGKALDYLKQEHEHYSGTANDEIKKAIEGIEGYLETLRSVPNLRELLPSQEQREVQSRQQSRTMSESFKEAQKGSIMELICSKSVLLYGRSSIFHIYDGAGKAHRQEIPLQPHSVSFEVPRQADINPFGLDYTLRVFRSERFRDI